MQIETRLLERSYKAVTNLTANLPELQSDLARESLKDPYRFDFLGLTDKAQEREVEHALVKHVTEFLLELGAGFAFVGRQVLLDVGGEMFRMATAKRRARHGLNVEMNLQMLILYPSWVVSFKRSWIRGLLVGFPCKLMEDFVDALQVPLRV